MPCARLLVASIILLSGCSFMTGVIDRSYPCWSRDGISRQEYREWAANGFCHRRCTVGWNTVSCQRTGYYADGYAAPWKKNGFTPSIARVWAEQDITADGALVCQRLGLEPKDCKEWHKVKVPKNPKDMSEVERTVGMWKSSGFTARKASEWANLDVSPEVAKSWERAGFQPSDVIALSGITQNTARAYKAAGFPNQEIAVWGRIFSASEASRIRNMKLDVESEHYVLRMGRSIMDWGKAKFPLEDAIYWSKAGFELEDAVKWRAAGFNWKHAQDMRMFGIRDVVSARTLSRKCADDVNSVMSLARTNPYDVKGHCYYFEGQALQVLSRTTALFTLANQPYHLDFGKVSASRIFFAGIVKGTGVFEYVSAIGTKQTAPSLAVVCTIHSDGEF